jgi:hypothetical protein
MAVAPAAARESPPRSRARVEGLDRPCLHRAATAGVGATAVCQARAPRGLPASARAEVEAGRALGCPHRS